GTPQSAPPVFLLIQRAIFVQFGDSEFVLRLIPLLAGLLGLVLFARLALRVLPAWPAIAAVGVLAFSTQAIWHSAEAKQYSTDLLVATGLMLAAFPRRRGEAGENPFDGETAENPNRQFAAVSLLAMVLMWFSHPAVFV